MGKGPSAKSSFRKMIHDAFWKNPIKVENEPDHLRAKDMNISETYQVITYKGQRINLNGQQLEAFNKMSRDAKRQVKNHWARMERKGEIIFQEINGHLIAVRNLDYEKRADVRK
jgi:hypothetical protein